MIRGAVTHRATIIAALCSAFWITSCTTVVKGFNEEFRVETIPAGAAVTSTLTSGARHTANGCEPTPCAFTISRKANFVARIEKPGYHTVRVVVRNSEFVRAEIDDQQLFADYMTDPAFNISDLGTIASIAAVNLNTNSSAAALLSTIFNTTELSLAAFYAGPVVTSLDASTGSAQNLYPNPVKIVLIPDEIEVPKAYKLRTAGDDDRVLSSLRTNGKTAD